jgi:hypothetical protein
LSNPAFSRPATGRFGGGRTPRGPIPVADPATPDTIASIVDEVVDTDTAPANTDQDATFAPPTSVSDTDTKPTNEPEPATSDAETATDTADTDADMVAATPEDPATQDLPGDPGETPDSEEPTATANEDVKPAQDTEATTPQPDSGPAEPADEPAPTPTKDPTLTPEAAQAETPPPAPAKKAAPKKGRRKTGNSDTTDEAGTNPLVVISDGKVHYVDSSVHVVNLDEARAVTDAHEVVDLIAGLAEVTDSDGKTEVITNLTDILTDKALGR